MSQLKQDTTKFSRILQCYKKCNTLIYTSYLLVKKDFIIDFVDFHTKDTIVVIVFYKDVTLTYFKVFFVFINVNTYLLVHIIFNL